MNVFTGHIAVSGMNVKTLQRWGFLLKYARTSLYGWRLGDSPYIDIRLERLLFIYDFNKLSLITPDGVHRFLYENSDVENARQDGVDTRLRAWEWWMQVDSEENNQQSAITSLSCSYHQIHGYLFETRSKNGFIHFEVTEQTAKQLYKAMTLSFSNLHPDYLVRDYQDLFIMPGTVCSIPDARFRVYKVRNT